MKKISYILLITFLFFLTDCNKKNKKSPPDLNTETTEEVMPDTIIHSTEHQQEKQVIKTEQDKNLKQNEQQVTKIKKENSSSKNQAVKKEGNYAVQLISLRNYDKILEIKRKLANNGYETELTTTTKNGTIFYRLRLKNTYSKQYAKIIGNEIKNKFKFINDYWIQKIKK